LNLLNTVEIMTRGLYFFLKHFHCLNIFFYIEKHLGRLVSIAWVIYPVHSTCGFLILSLIEATSCMIVRISKFPIKEGRHSNEQLVFLPEVRSLWPHSRNTCSSSSMQHAIIEWIIWQARLGEKDWRKDGDAYHTKIKCFEELIFAFEKNTVLHVRIVVWELLIFFQ